MSDRQRLRLDLVACGLLITGLFVALCVFSYAPVEDTAGRIYPGPAVPNLLGPPGAWLAESLHDSLGVTVYLLLASWFVLVVLLFLRRSWLTWLLRLAGWLLLLPCGAVLADRLGPAWLGGPLPGSGGSLGAWLRTWLDTQLRPAGEGVLLSAGVVLGLFLAADVLIFGLLWGAGRVCRGLARGGWRLGGWLRRQVPRRRPRAAVGLTPAGTEEAAPPTVPAAPARSGHVRRSAAATAAAPSTAPTPATPPPAPPAPAEGPATTAAVPPESVPPAPEDRDIPIHHHDHTVDPGELSAAAALAARSEPPIQRSAAALDAERFADYELPPLTLLEDPQPFPYAEHDQMLRERATLLEKTFADFSLNVRVVGINTGPVITQYEVALETGLRVHKVTRLGDDLALNLGVPSVRIVAPIPGKNTVGIEIPNEQRAMVRLKEVLLATGKKVARARIPLFLGKDAEGKPLVHDLAEMPHLLIAGRTGTGKSVCMNAIILSILMTRRPDEVKMIMIDPKMLELSEYGKVPHLMHPVVKDMKKAEAILAWAVDKMEERYDLLSRARVRSIAGYNELAPAEILRRVQPADEEERDRIPERMPYIIIFVDEMADLIMMMKKEVEGHIIRLAQKSRAAGIHLVVATQKPTVDVITGLIKSNLPARICFKVVNKSDSRVVLDEMGADKFLGKGDMLFLQPGTSTLIRAQGTYLSDEEIQRVVEHLECDPCYAQELIQLHASKDGPGGLLENLRGRDELYEPAIEIVLREGRGSVSLLQRALGIGYGRAARLIDFMAEDGIVGAYNGSSAREVLYTLEQWEQLKAGTPEA